MIKKLQERYPFLSTPTVVLGFIGITALVAMMVVIPLRFGGEQESLIVFYSVNNARIQEGTMATLFRIPTIGIIIFAVNSGIAFTIAKTNKYFAQAALMLASMLQVALLLAIIALDHVNL